MPNLAAESADDIGRVKPVSPPAPASSSAESDRPERAPTRASAGDAAPAAYLTFAERHKMGALAVAFVPPDGARALSSGVDDVARLWDTRTGAVIKRYVGKAYRFQSLAFDKSGAHVLTAGEPGARYWETDTGKVLKTLSVQHWGVARVALAPDERSAATVGGGGAGLTVWDLDAGTEARRFDDVGAPLALAYSGDSRQLAWLTENNRLCQLETKGVAPPRCRELATTQLDSASFGGAQLLTGDREGVVALWDLDGRRIRGWPAHEATMTRGIDQIVFAPGQSLAVSSGPDRAIRAWNTKDGKKAGELPAVPGFFSIVAISPDGRRILFTTEDGAIHLWTLAGG